MGIILSRVFQLSGGVTTLGAELESRAHRIRVPSSVQQIPEADMPKSWTSGTQFKRIAGGLAVTRGYEFQREALNLVRLSWPDAFEVPTMSTFDQKGADHLVWADSGALPLVVQCKGFHAPYLGEVQVDQVIKSIDAFRRSGLTTDRYVVLHNQDGRSLTFRAAVEKALQLLAAEGRAKVAELHDRRSFVALAFDRMYQRTLGSIDQLGMDHSARRDLIEAPLGDDVVVVPVRQSTLLADSYSVASSEHSRGHIADPVELLSRRNADLVVLLGGFGSGKTTAALRAVAKRGGRVLYVPAAGISGHPRGTKAFLLQCIEVERILEGLPEELHPLATDILLAVIEYVLKDPDVGLSLLLDGLDESVFFTRSGGIAWLFNLLMEVRIPIILTARSEFWFARQADLFTLEPTTTRRTNPPKRRAMLVELLPWGKMQILECIDQRLRAQTDMARQKHLRELRLAVEQDQLGVYYHDVPTRPLFLRYIIETAEADGLRQIGPAGLFWRWLELKIERDYRRPLQQGGHGRLPPIESALSLAEIGKLALLAMRHAARAMAVADVDTGEPTSLELISSCSLEDLQRSNSKLADLDLAGLVLYTLLRPTQPSKGLATPRLGFAHRSYQEYFTALDVMCSDEGPSRIEKYPSEVIAWHEAMVRESFPNPF